MEIQQSIDIDEQKRARIIKSITSKVVEDENPLAVLLIGSTARNIHTIDSDIDIAVFYNQYKEQHLKCFEIDNINVGIERYDVSKFLKLPDIPMLKDKDLREVGRLTKSKVLYSNWNGLEQLLIKFNASILSPENAGFLLNTARDNLQAAISSTAFSDVWLSLQGCATSLARLKLTFSPFKYQKPKWLLYDLSLLKDDRLYLINQFLYSVNNKSAHHIMKLVESCILEACAAAKFPGLILAPNEIYEFRYMHRTWLDAKSLLARNDEFGCKYTTLTSFRQMATILADPKIEAKLSNNFRNNWIEDSIQTLFEGKQPSLINLLSYAEKLEEIGQELVNVCINCYHKNDTPLIYH